jgi:hypothetical protein
MNAERPRRIWSLARHHPTPRSPSATIPYNQPVIIAGPKFHAIGMPVRDCLARPPSQFPRPRRALTIAGRDRRPLYDQPRVTFPVSALRHELSGRDRASRTNPAVPFTKASSTVPGLLVRLLRSLYPVSCPSTSPSFLVRSSQGFTASSQPSNSLTSAKDYYVAYERCERGWSGSGALRDGVGLGNLPF